MIVFKEMGILERILRICWPAYRLKREAETEAAIRYLCQNPQVPCVVEGELISNGFGR